MSTRKKKENNEVSNERTGKQIESKWNILFNYRKITFNFITNFLSDKAIKI